MVKSKKNPDKNTADLWFEKFKQTKDFHKLTNTDMACAVQYYFDHSRIKSDKMTFKKFYQKY